jgi:hypothetical protein
MHQRWTNSTANDLKFVFAHRFACAVVRSECVIERDFIVVKAEFDVVLIQLRSSAWRA